jgi:hypothetical protein
LIVRAGAGRLKWVDLKLTLSTLIFAPLHDFIIILGLGHSDRCAPSLAA